MDRSQILQCIYDAIASVNETMSADRQIKASEESALAGSDAALSSLEFVTLIAEIEQSIEDATGESPELMAAAGSEDGAAAFATVGALADTIGSQLNGASE